jgi:predicted dehydrogenase/threonine dehydrogenase-like Zn-dependent dehydrogenase
MQQVVQSFRDGKTIVVDVPWPHLKPQHLLIGTRASLISAGTERMLLEFGKAGLLKKAYGQPAQVRRVLEKIRTDGLMPTLEAVRSKLDHPISMGYSNVGTVLEVGGGVSGFEKRDRVVSNGPHAEVVAVGKNLCNKIPANVPDEMAAFTVVGAIALEGIRRAAPTLGESVAVIGLGLVGLLTVQLLRAHGCRVIGIDLNHDRTALARQFGAETVDLSRGADPVRAAVSFSRGSGVDAVLIAAATKSEQPMRQAALMSRKRGRIVLIGDVGTRLSRSDFYEKELSFQVSCSYGPGRYDPHYEEQGHDYPLPYVRWTEQRNFAAVLEMMSEGRIDVGPLISHRFSLSRAVDAYELLTSSEPSLGILLSYTQLPSRQDEDPCCRPANLRVVLPTAEKTNATPSVGFIGAGNFASRILIPAFQRAGARLHMVASTGGVTGWHAARKFEISQVTTDVKQVIESADVDVVVVATRHDTHAKFVCEALQAGKHVFVEKPLALNQWELDEIIGSYRAIQRTGRQPALMVGFNRRFAPQVRAIAQMLEEIDEPKSFIVTVNAGAIPANHWTQDPDIGGGRIIGEACHFIDLLRFLCGHRVTAVQATMIGAGPGIAVREDKMSFTLQFADGSFGTVHYLANGSRAFPKERLDLFCGGRVIQLDNFRKLRAYGCRGIRGRSGWRQDKGYTAEVAAFLDAVKSAQPTPIPFEQSVETTRVSFDVLQAAASGQTVRYPVDGPPAIGAGAAASTNGPEPIAQSA